MLVRHRAPFASRGLPVMRPVDFPFERMFDQLTQSLFEPRRRVPTVDASWRDGSLVLDVDLPGVPAEAVNVEVAGRALTVGVQTDDLQWERSLGLPTTVDPAKVSARHVDGRLTVTVGAVDAPEARRIAIDTTPETRPVAAIDTGTADGTTDAESVADDQPTGTSSTG